MQAAPDLNTAPAHHEPSGPVGRRIPWTPVLWGAVLAVAVVVAVAWESRRHQEELDAPILASLTEMSLGVRETRLAARSWLVSQSTNASPALTRVIALNRTRWRSEILPWLEGLPLIARQRAREQQMERDAIEVLQRIGPPAAPDLLPLLAEPHHGGRETAIALLRTYGPTVAPLIVALLDHHQPEARIGAARALARFLPTEQGDLGHLARATRDPVASVRAAAVASLAQMHHHPDEALPPIIAALEDPSPVVQMQAVVGLRPFGTRAAAAVEPLRQRLREGASDIRAQTALTLSLLGPEARAAQPELLEALRGTATAPSRHAAGALVHLDLHSTESLERLRSFLGARDASTRSQTLEVLASLGPKATPLTNDILVLLRNDDPRDDRAAVFALRYVAPDLIPPEFRRRRR